MITNEQYKELGFQFFWQDVFAKRRVSKKKAFRRKEKVLALREDVAIVIRGGTMFILSGPQVNVYKSSYSCNADEIYFRWLWQQPNKDIKKLSFNEVKHIINTIKDSLND